MVSEAKPRVPAIAGRGAGKGETSRGEGVRPNHLHKILWPFREHYRGILKERAKLSYVATRRAKTTPYQTFLYQEGLDDLKIAIGELESEIAKSVYSNLSVLVEDYLEAAITGSLERGRRKGVKLPNHPSNPKDVRPILYRMYRGGSFYPLIFPREVESEFFRVLGSRISLEGMRGREISARTRALVLRLRLDLREMIHQGLEASKSLENMGFVRWSWRRGNVVRRMAYAPAALREEAQRIIAILDRAVSMRDVMSGRARLPKR